MNDINHIIQGKFKSSKKVILEEFLEGEAFDEVIESLTLKSQEESLSNLNWYDN